ADSYPIVTYTWLLLYKQYDDEKRKAALKEFVVWCLNDGQQYNEGLGFIRLAPDVASRATKAVEQL
ncbi:MAG: phosphate ABC transporter substrate-binding protein PstS, partial [Pirellulales bacterium]|nr:phosphate ABC transporter substrate-binding protein PstS [Pirellulales bacterium]